MGRTTLFLLDRGVSHSLLLQGCLTLWIPMAHEIQRETLVKECETKYSGVDVVKKLE
jgi:hypothetical protein